MKRLNGGGAHRRASNVVEHPAAQAKPSLPLGTPAPEAPVSTASVPQTRPPGAPRPRARLSELLISEQVSPAVVEEFRRIKRPLLANAFGKGAVKVDRGNLIMVTSAVPGEGKSRTALNLAHAIALERDHTVLVVDADVAKGQVTRAYGMERARGLVDLLQDRSLAVEQLVAETSVPGLSVLPAGQHSAYVTELLASNEMERLALQLIEQAPARVVVFDSPPLLATNEPQSLAGVVGQIVLVVEAGRTPQHLVKEAVGMLDHAKAIGLVLNKSRHSFGGDYYGGYYGYYYGADATPTGRPPR